jgi:hypothetical protein
MAMPPQEIGRMMSGVEAAELILRHATQAKVLTKDEEHRVGVDIVRLRAQLRKQTAAEVPHHQRAPIAAPLGREDQ